MNVSLRSRFIVLSSKVVKIIKPLYTQNRVIGLVGTVFANGPEDLDSVSDHVIPKTLKWYLILPCLTLCSIMYVLREKWSNLEKGVAPYPTLRFSSY